MQTFATVKSRYGPAGGLYRYLEHPVSRWSSFLLVLCMVSVQPVHHVYASATTTGSGTDAAEIVVPTEEADHESEDKRERESNTTSPEMITSDTDDEIVESDSSRSDMATTSATEIPDTVTDHTESEGELSTTTTTTLSTVLGTSTAISSASDDDYDTMSATTSTSSLISGDKKEEVAGEATSTEATATSSDIDRSATGSGPGSHSTTPDSESESSAKENEISVADSDTESSSAGDEERRETLSTEDDQSTHATGTSEQIEQEYSAHSHSEVFNSQNRHQFSEKECIPVGDGAYYCQRPTATDTEGSETDIVFSRLTSSGYRDIFLQSTRGVSNITNSMYDDAGPHYDPVSESVVWHREIDGRHQIMSYDIVRDEKRQLTETRTNDMEPTRSGDTTVWQRWVDDRWQVIILQNGQEEVQLTNDSVHNLAPYVRGDHVIWNTYTVFGEPRVAVFDTTTEHISYIDNSEDGRVSNPRFVLVYDTLLASGDRVTQEFDPTTGTSRPVSSIPTPPLPEIPSSDPVGEVRALQTKNQEEDPDTHLVDGGDDGIDEPTPTNATGSLATTSPVGDIDMRAATTSSSTLSEYDLPIPDYATSTGEYSSTTDEFLDRE